MKHLLIWLFLIFSISSCQTVSVPDVLVCVVFDSVENGALCSSTISKKKSELTFEQLILLINSGSAIIKMSDFVKIKEALEVACTEVKCKPSVLRLLDNMGPLF